ncbi:MAG: histidine kinase [Oscillospiraceae bacterium]|nr:histidine kinase [Oscillospiraceae bacterium]
MNIATGIINLYCTLIGSALLITAYDKIRRKCLSTASRRYVGALLSGTVMSFCSGIFYLAPFNQQTLLLSILEVMIIVCFYSAYVFCCSYIITYLQDVHQTVSWHVFYAAISVSCISILMWIGTAVHPYIYDFALKKYVSIKMFWLGSIPALIVELMVFWLLLRYRKALGNPTTFWFSFLIFFPWTANAIEYFYPGLNMRSPFLMISLLIIYVIIHVELDRKVQEQERIILQERLKLTIERIKPHYIYNVLSSIYYLCDSDPQKAQSAIGQFSDFLRSTFSVLDRNENVSFEWELDLVRNYIGLEQMRFSKPFLVSYQVEATSFSVPPLSLQVIVENAIKHGLKNKDQIGEILIKSTERKEDFCIQVKDNGSGFDVEKTFHDQKNTALSNVRDRLAIQCGGTMVITSIPGNGTAVELHIPKEAAITS